MIQQTFFLFLLRKKVFCTFWIEWLIFQNSLLNKKALKLSPLSTVKKGKKRRDNFSNMQMHLLSTLPIGPFSLKMVVEKTKHLLQKQSLGARTCFKFLRPKKKHANVKIWGIFVSSFFYNFVKHNGHNKVTRIFLSIAKSLKCGLLKESRVTQVPLC